MKALKIGLCSAIACLALHACASSRLVENSSETHFLASCESSCEAGLTCICGVCTEACERDSSCEHLSAGASCVTPESASCEAVPSCDVECERDSDCSAIANRACEAGRCREAMMSNMDAGGDGDGDGDGGSSVAVPMPLTCDIDGLRDLLIEGDFESCGAPSADPDAGISGEALEATRVCVSDALASGKAFLVFGTSTGTDSVLGDGYLGVPDGDAMRVYEVSTDSYYGYEPDGRTLIWTPCASFHVKETCEDGSCFNCDEDVTQTCGCVPRREEGTFDLDETLAVHCAQPDAPPCAGDSCEFDGVCYPLGEATEDGCCMCDEAGGSCIEPAWCPGWTAIGDTCTDNSDCGTGNGGEESSGLVCGLLLAMGDASVCTRTCNFGCPTGTECVEAPLRAGGTERVCLLP